jgi:hypothetical protein
MSDETNLLLNVEEAKQFASQLSDPIAKELCWAMFAVINFRMHGIQPSAPFDALYLFQLLAEICSDKDQLAHIISLAQ